jgi:P2-related tail formation protein
LIDLKDSELHGLLPPNFKDDGEVKALCYALDRLLDDFYAKLRRTFIWSAVKDADAEIIDYLAAELRTPFYKDTLDIETRRAMVANTFIWYSKLGTKDVIEDVVSSVFGATDVAEWFEYGGEPYFFRISTEGRIGSQEEYDDFIQLLGFLKNTRSWLEKITLKREATRQVYIGHGVRQARHERPLLANYESQDYQGELYIGHGVRQYRHERPLLADYESKDYQGRLYIGHGARQYRHERPMLPDYESPDYQVLLYFGHGVRQYRHERPFVQWFDSRAAIRTAACTRIIHTTKVTVLRMEVCDG